MIIIIVKDVSFRMKGVYRVSLVKLPLKSTLSYLLIFPLFHNLK